MTAQKPFRLGILLVHGIGTQPAGDTITSWGDTLVKTITAATRGAVTATVERAGPDLPGGDGERIEACVRLRKEGSDDEEWLLAEGWWAESFIAPTYFEFCSWSVRALPWALAMHSAQRYWAVKSQAVRKSDAVRFAAVKLVLGLLLAPLVITALFVILLLGLVPIPALRGALLGAQRLFTATVGDSLVFVESPLRSGLIKSRILSGLEALEQRCDKTLVLAHSQGAAAAIEALGGIEGLNAPPRHQATTLLTFGAGTNQLSVLRRSEALPANARVNPLKLSLLAGVAVSGFSGYLTSEVLNRRLAPENVLLAFALWGVLGVLLVGLGFGGVRLSRRFTSAAPRRAVQVGTAIVSISFGILGMLTLYQRATPDNIPVAPALGLVLAFGLLVQATYTILSKNWERIMTTVRYPPGLHRWIDIRASADPIAAGPTLTRAATPVDAQIWNEGSLISDHVRYWKNLDEFVLRVARACAKTAASPWVEELPAQAKEIDDRANWRVSWLRFMRIAFTTIAVGLGITLYHTSFDVICRLTDSLPGWVLNRIAHPDLERGTLLVLIAVGCMAPYWLSRTIWRWWVAREQATILDHAAPQGLETIPLLALGTIVWAALLVAVKLTLAAISLPAAAAPLSWAQILTQGALILAGLVGLSAISTYALKKINKPPLLPAAAFPATVSAPRAAPPRLA